MLLLLHSVGEEIATAEKKKYTYLEIFTEVSKATIKSTSSRAVHRRKKNQMHLN